MGEPTQDQSNSEINSIQILVDGCKKYGWRPPDKTREQSLQDIRAILISIP